MQLILLGAPGTGKGTQASILADRFNWPHISTGDMLRSAVADATALGVRAKAFMDQGALVPDDLVIDMLVERLRAKDAEIGFVLDGFPRTLAQAIALDESLALEGKAIDLVLNISVPDQELVQRLSGRWLCRACGAIYHEQMNPPSEHGRCDKCSGELYQREDDKPETVRSRLELQKLPPDLVAHYRDGQKLVDINGSQAVESVTQDLMTWVNQGTESARRR